MSPPKSKGGRAKPQKKRRSPWVRVLKWGLVSLLVGAVLGAGVLVGGYLWFARDLPDFTTLKDYQPPQVSRVHAADGTVVAEFFTERRTVVGREQMADVLVQAVLSAEDADFYKHEGLDYTGMLRALWNSFRAGHVTGSGSTITQQTVKLLLLTPEKTLERKAKELILARRLESSLSKDEILTLYLNAAYFGHGRYGVEEAAQYYFGKPAKKVTVPEAAVLAGIVQSPERLSPRKHPERARDRRAYVLREMAENGYITQAQADEAAKAGFQLAEVEELPLPEAGWFVEEVRRQVAAVVGSERLLNGGLKIETTLDLERQRAALAAVREGLREIDARQKFAEKVPVEPKARWDRWREKRVKALGGQPPAAGRVVPALLVAVKDGALELDLGVGRARIAAAGTKRWLGDKGELPWAPGAVLPVAVRDDGPKHPEVMRAVLHVGPQGAFVALDPQTRRVLALVGGEDFLEQPFDRATQARRQPGSTFKPFVYGAALASRKYSPSTRVIDAPEVLPLGNGKFWEPKNFSAKFEGPLSLRVALAKSINSIAIRVANDVGVPAVHAFAKGAGITSPLADNLTVALGSSEVSPLELANAFATFAADGRRDAPRMVLAVSGPDGARVPGLGVSEDAPPEPAQVVDPAVAWVLRSMMRSVVTEGSGTRLKDVPRPVVGKTGTSNDARDTWFVGLLPEVAMVAWIGFDDPRTLGSKETGGRAAAPVARAFALATAKEGPAWSPAPEGVVSANIDPKTGQLAASGGAQEWYLAGTEPKETAPAAGEIDAGNFFFEELGGGAPAPPSEATAPAPARAGDDEDAPEDDLSD